MHRNWISFLLFASLAWAAPLKVLIVDGQNNHNWQATTPVLRKLLEETGKFRVDVATSPSKGGDMSAFQPRFQEYAVVVLNYNGDPWAQETKRAFEEYVRRGGGFVAYHAADNAFPEWREYQEMTAVGGWGDRKAEAFGPRIRWKDGRAALDPAPGKCGNHGSRRPFQVTVRDGKHPIVKGLPAVWTHAADELYDSLCGPAKRFQVIATALSDPADKGTGEHEPMLLTVQYGKGRVFHTTLGHDVPAMQCVGFIATFQRGAEWVATGKVTQKVPPDFPGATAVSVRR